MAKIVLIKNPTSDQEHIGDIIAVHDDKDVLGPAYASFQIVEVAGTVAEVKKAIKESIPVRKVAYKSASKNQWTFAPPEEKLVWDNNGEWEELAKPKNIARIENYVGLTVENIKSRTSHNMASKGKVTVS